jgi:hypothetical protein
VAVGDIHTVHKNGVWRNEVEGGARLGGTHASREEAVAYGRDEAIERKTGHIIHNIEGTISERNSYGNDPPSLPG